MADSPIAWLLERLRDFTDRLFGESSDWERGGCILGGIFILIVGMIMAYLLANRSENIQDRAGGSGNQYCYDEYIGGTVRQKCVPTQ